MCDGGVATWKRSSAVRPRASTQWRVPAPSEAWVWRTAFGMPVVPELNTRIDSSSARAVGLGQGRAIAAEERRPAWRASSTSITAAPRCSASTSAPGSSATADGGAGELEGVAHLALPRRAEQHGGGAELADGVDGDDELGSVREHDRDTVADRRRRVRPGTGRRSCCSSSSSRKVSVDVVGPQGDAVADALRRLGRARRGGGRPSGAGHLWPGARPSRPCRWR